MVRQTISFECKRTDRERRTKQAEKLLRMLKLLEWLLPWTGFAEVIKPIELRQRFVEQLEAGLRMNRGED